MQFRPRFLLRALCVLGLLGAASPPLRTVKARSPAAPESVQPAAPAVPGPIDSRPIRLARPVDKRVFGVLPNYRTAKDTADYTPITSKQKLIIATKDTIDYPLFLLGGGWRDRATHR